MISRPTPDSADERGVVSSCHIWLGSIQRRPGHCDAHTPVCAELLLVSSIDLWIHGWSTQLLSRKTDSQSPEE